MPMFNKVVRHLNRQLDDDHVDAFAQNVGRFAPGERLDVAVLDFPDAALARLFQSYLDHLPSSFPETLRALLYHALTASPPIPISFSWAPAYDYELSIWQPTCGILVQFRGPNPREV